LPAFHELAGLGSAVILLAAAVASLPGFARLPSWGRAAVLAAAVLAALVPVGWLPVAAYLRSYVGDLSITTLVLLGRVLARRLAGWQPTDARAMRTLSALVLAGAVLLYPSALGFVPFDSYAAGYANPSFVAILGAIALGAWVARADVAALCLAAAVLAWAGGWYGSTNLWDYLLDPLVAGYALVALPRRRPRTHPDRAPQHRFGYTARP
jgi:hypothetical protein